MNTADWIESEFERLAQSPEGIPKLREFVLQLAVQGKLVPQDSNDEPASDKSVGLNGSFFTIPRSWRSDKLGLIAKVFAGSSAPQDKEYFANGTELFIRTGDVGRLCRTTSLCDSSDKLNQAAVRELKLVYAKSGTIIFPKSGASILTNNRALLGTDAYIVSHLCAVEPNNEIISNLFLYHWLCLVDMGFFSQNSTYPSLKLSEVKSIEIPLPPLAEQHRIVAKVDELMALCDELEAKQTAKAQTKEALNGAALHHVRSATNPAELDSATRFYVGQMDTLADVPQAIPPIRETILQLAVQGKLVPQDSNDEPASELLKRIAAEKEQLVKDGKIKKPKPLPPIEEDELPFEIPKSWEWIHAAPLCEHITKGTTPSKELLRDHGKIPFLKVYNLTFNGTLNYQYKATYIDRETHEGPLARSRVFPNDVLMNIVGPPLGKVSLVPTDYPEWNVNQAISIFRSLGAIRPHYLVLCLLNSQNFMAAAGLETRGTVGQDNISLGQCRVMPIPLPPLAEQHRIVAKVDELMALCDQLETRLTTAQDLNQQLTQAILAQTA